MATNLWGAALKDLDQFNTLYAQAQRKPELRLLKKCANAARNSVGLFMWTKKALTPDIYEVFRGPWVALSKLSKNSEANAEELRASIETYKEAVQAVLDSTAPENFTYEGFKISNPEHLASALCRVAFNGIDALKVLFKKRGVIRLLEQGIVLVNLTIEDGAVAFFNSGNRELTISVSELAKSRSQVTEDPAVQTVIHEFGHFIHRNYITGEARDAWDAPWGDLPSLANPHTPRGPNPRRDQQLAPLEIVTEYGKTDKFEDFAETFMIFIVAPERLTPTAKFRMQRALSLSGLYGKPVLQKTANEILFRATEDPVARKGAHFAENEDDALTYTDNPGFGGSKVYSYVASGAILDCTNRRGGRKALAEAFLEDATETDRNRLPINEPISPRDLSDYWGQVVGLQHVFQVLENESDVSKVLARNYDWIKFTDDFPAGSTTWCLLDNRAIEPKELIYTKAAHQVLRRRVIQAAYLNPHLRSHLLPLLRTAKTLDLDQWRLSGIAEGEPVMLYHGTTRTFSTFDPSKSRAELVNKFYGSGIFLTPSKRVAWDYASANRNIGFEPDIIDDLRHINRPAADFMETLYKKGNDAWDMWSREALGLAPDDSYIDALGEVAGGVDPNTLADICRWVLGSKLVSEVQENSGFVNIFHQNTGMPGYVYDMLDEVGLDSKKYRPKVYTVVVTVQNPLVTASKSAARSARSKGYDSVVFYGADLVEGVPEVAVFDPRNARITHVEVES